MPIRRLGFICLTLVGLLGACAGPVPPASPDDAVIYVIERDWHTDIGLPVEEIAGPLQILTTSFPGVRFLTFGFGERQFLIDRSRSAGAMLSALLPSESAVLMTALRASPAAAFGQENVVALHVSQAGLQAIKAEIWRGFERSATGEPVLLAEGPYPGSVYFAAGDTYSALFTCNTWTAATLRTSGLPVRDFGVLFAGQVMSQVRGLGAQQTASPVDRRVSP